MSNDKQTATNTDEGKKPVSLYPCAICGEKIPVTPNAFSGAPLICPDCHAVYALEITLVCE